MMFSGVLTPNNNDNDNEDDNNDDDVLLGVLPPNHKPIWRRLLAHDEPRPPGQTSR